jgi:hypothetical protein
MHPTIPFNAPKIPALTTWRPFCMMVGTTPFNAQRGCIGFMPHLGHASRL